MHKFGQGAAARAVCKHSPAVRATAARGSSRERLGLRAATAGLLGAACFVGAAGVALRVPPARADFVPGRLYIGTRPLEPCWFFPDDPPVRIYEFDPATGASKLLYELPESICGQMTGLEFSPDGSHLLASVYDKGKIHMLDGSGTITGSLGSAGGIFRPLVNMDFDTKGDLYVPNVASSDIVKLPGGKGPAVQFADVSSAEAGGWLATAPDGSVYYAPIDGQKLLRFTAQGVSSVFKPSGASLRGVQIDGQGNVFVSADGI